MAPTNCSPCTARTADALSASDLKGVTVLPGGPAGPEATRPPRVDALGPAHHAGRPVPAREHPARIIAGGDFGGPDRLVLGWGPAWTSDR